MARTQAWVALFVVAVAYAATPAWAGLQDYQFYSQQDAPGVTIRVVAVSDVAALAALCDDTPPCVAFNTRGELKAGLSDGVVGALMPMAGVASDQGVYVQRQPRTWLGGVLPIRYADADELARLQEESAVHIAAVTTMITIRKQCDKASATLFQNQAASSTTSTSASNTDVTKASFAASTSTSVTTTTTTTTTTSKTTVPGSGDFSGPIIRKLNTSVLIKTLLTPEQLTSLTQQSVQSLLTQKQYSVLVRNTTRFSQRVADYVLQYIDLYAFSWDSRTSGGANWVSPVQNQGQCGSCTAFATVAVGEVARAVALKRAGTKELSEQFLFFCNHVARHKRICSNGMFAGDATTEVVTYGFRWDTCYPYTPSLGSSTCGYTSPSCAALRTGTGTPGKWAQLVFSDPFSIKAHIRQYGAVVTSFYTNGRLNSYTGGVIINNGALDRTSGHSVAVIGWNDIGQYWIAKNSWGYWWGESGYFRISYSDPMFCKNGDFGPPVGLTYAPTFLETHPWFSTVIDPIKKLPTVVG